MSWWTPPPPAAYPSSASAASPPPAAVLMDDTMDEPETAPSHLPGYLTAHLRGSPKGVHAQPDSPSFSRASALSMQDRPAAHDGWLSSSGGGSGGFGSPARGYSGGGGGLAGSLGGGGGMGSPSASRFGTGGLFDRSPTLSTALTVSQLDSQRPARRGQPGASADDDDEWGPPVLSLEESAAAGEGGAWEAVGAGSGAPGEGAAETYPSSSSLAPPAAHTELILFGPPPALHPALIAHFAALGPIAHAQSDPAGGNWVTVAFCSELDARRALARNGDVLGGGWMVGVKWADALHTAAGGARPAPSPALATSPRPAAAKIANASTTPGAGGAAGTPVRLAPAAAAFKRLVPAAAAGGATAGRDRALAEAAAQGGAQPQQQQQQQGGGLMGRLGELVFGF